MSTLCFPHFPTFCVRTMSIVRKNQPQVTGPSFSFLICHKPNLIPYLSPGVISTHESQLCELLTIKFHAPYTTRDLSSRMTRDLSQFSQRETVDLAGAG